MSKKLRIGLLIALVCFVVAVSGCVSSPVKVVVSYPGSWNGTITTDSENKTISGTGDQTFDLGGYVGSLMTKVQKNDGGNDTLTVSIIRGDKTIQSQNTTASIDYVITSIKLTA